MRVRSAPLRHAHWFCLIVAGALHHGNVCAQGKDVIVTRLPQSQAEVSIAVNPTNPSNIVVIGNSEAVTDHGNASYSMDGGKSWRAVELGRNYPTCSATNAKGDCINSFRADPALTFDDNGRLYVAMGAPPSGELALCISADGGQTYEGCTRIQAAPSGADKWLVAAGPDPCIANTPPCSPVRQNVYIAWTDSGSIQFMRSVDGGRHFSSPVTGIGGSGLGAQPAVGPNGEVYVTWYGADQVFIARSTDGGQNFLDPVFVTASNTQGPPRNNQTGGHILPAQPNRGVFTGPVVDVDRSGGSFNGRIYVAYTNRGSGGADDIDIFVRTSDDQGEHWSDPVRVNDDRGTNSQFLPWLSVDRRTGLVSVAWYDARNDTANELVEVYTAFSADGGANFSENIRVSDGPTNGRLSFVNLLEYIGIHTWECVAYLVWSDNHKTLDLDYVSDVVAAPLCPGGHGRSLRSLVGDRDNFHGGDAVDSPTRSPKVQQLVSYIASIPGQGTGVNLDVGGANRPVGLTHHFRLPPNARLTSAVVKFRVKSIDSLVYNDGLYYNDTTIPSLGSPILPVIALRDLRGGREPVLGPNGAPFNEEIILNLGNAPVRVKDTTGGPGGHWTGPPDALRDLLPMLMRDGRLDLIFSDDLTVDYSELSMTYAVPAHDPAGDVTGDGQVDQDDVALLMRTLNTEAYVGDPRDINRDGRITIEDVRAVTGLCAHPRCAK